MIKYSKTKNSIKNIMWGIINKVLVLFWPFLIRSLMIQKLGVEYLGLSSLFTSILQMMSLAELGFGSAMVYAMYRPIAENKIDEVNGLLNFYKKVYRIIGIIILCVGMVLTPVLPKLINGTFPSDINLYILYFIYLSNTVSSYWLFSYKNSLLTAYHRADLSSKISTCTHLGMYVIQCIVLILLSNYYIYAIILPVTTVLNNIITHILTKRVFPENLAKGSVLKSERQNIAKRVSALMGHKLGAVITNSTDNIVISSFLGLAILANYNNYYQIITSLIGLFAILNSSLIAGLGNSIVIDSVKKNYNILKGITFINVWAVSWCAICLMCLYQPFVTLWLGADYLLPISTVILLAFYFYIWKFKDMLALYKDAAGMWYEDRWKPLVYCVVNIVISILLVQYIGVNGVIIGTIVSQIFVAIPWETIVFFEKYIYSDCELIGEIYKYGRKMLTYTLIFILVGFLTFFLCDMVTVKNELVNLMIRGIFCLIVPNSIYIAIFKNTEEFKFLVSRISRSFLYDSSIGNARKGG